MQKIKLYSAVLGGLILIVVVGIYVFFTKPEPLTTADVPTENLGHFVQVKLPEDPKSIGAKVTLDMQGKTPQTKPFNGNDDLSAEMAWMVRFDVGPEVKPATLNIEYVSGEVKFLKSVIFDTVLTAP